MMLAWTLLDKAAVVCDADRVAGAKWAAQALHSNVIVLDDAFQHLRIARDLDVVCVDATNPWGNGRLFPAGILREPVSSLRRADCVVVTRAKPNADLQQQITQTTDAPILSSTTVIERISALDFPHSEIDKDAVSKLPFSAFCGIGNPNAFFQQLRDEGFDLPHTEAFRDHHNYSQSDIEGLTKRASDSGAQAVITTSKDAVKLQSIRFPLPCYVAEIGIEISEAEKLLEIIDRAIQAKCSERNR
jgi:tetraacyldisaccharide 4'-kinase